MSAKQNQTARVLEFMEKHGGITQLEALSEISVMRLASRVSDLRKLGYPIESETVTVCNRYGEKCRVKRYRLAVMNDG